MRRLLGCVALVTAFGVLHAIPMAQDPKDPGIGDPQVGGVCTAARIQGFASDERKATWQLADNCKYFVTLFTQTIHYGTKSTPQLIVPAVALSIIYPSKSPLLQYFLH